ncbi:MAG: ABC transporter ATP-binding protein [Prochloraceae cyanobacterium]|nr:ABC transporter ATP-binding protein [Prochloraceae cyanobacterium]
MRENSVISLKNVSKCFKRYDRPVDRLKEILLPKVNRGREFWALTDINIEISKGETVGIIGRNGSGKSTLLQIIVGTLSPTRGQVNIQGRISALLELGSGFNPEFTGRQNVFFNGQLLGLSKQEIAAKFDDIASFADIGDFIDQPVKTYSSGMFVRLAFAVAVNVDPEILIVDEALAVGDVVFQHRCMKHMRQLMDSGVTTLFVSHDPSAIKTLCSSALMIHDGQIYNRGCPDTIMSEYLKLMTTIELGLSESQSTIESERDEPKQAAKPDVEKIETTPEAENNQSDRQDTNCSEYISLSPMSRRGSNRAVIEDFKIINQQGEFSEHPIFEFNELVTLLVNLRINEPLQGCIVGFHICDKNGNEILGTNTWEENRPIGTLEAGEKLEVKFQFRLPLRTGSYSLTVALAEDRTKVTCDWIDRAIVFQVLPPRTGKTIYALVDQPTKVNITKNGVAVSC